MFPDNKQLFELTAFIPLMVLSNSSVLNVGCLTCTGSYRMAGWPVSNIVSVSHVIVRIYCGIRDEDEEAPCFRGRGISFWQCPTRADQQRIVPSILYCSCCHGRRGSGIWKGRSLPPCLLTNGLRCVEQGGAGFTAVCKHGLSRGNFLACRLESI